MPKRGEKFMQNVNVQTSLSDVYENVLCTVKPDNSNFLKTLKAYIDISSLIPKKVAVAWNKSTGRPRGRTLESFLWFFLLRNIIGIHNDSTFLTVMMLSPEIREFCGFTSVPEAWELTLFKKDFADYLELMFGSLVDVTEPICRELDPKKSDYLLYDTTGVKANVAENNPKFIEAKLSAAKKAATKNPELNPYALVYSNLPDTAKANPDVRHQYINGHFCYAHKAGILTNGIGIVRHIAFFDDAFRAKHPDIVEQKTDNPDLDKEIGDSTSLKPVLSDFFEAHQSFDYKTFIADSSFDSYDNYTMLKNDFHFDRICIPINPRNSNTAHSDFDSNGTPLCPIDKTPFTFLGISKGKNRSARFKFVCHKSIRVNRNSKRVCSCDTPCTTKSYGRCVYTYPHKNLRLYPGIPRGTQHWDNLYRHRTLIERTINIFKDDFGLAHRRSFSTASAKADLFLAGITQLLGVIFAHVINQPKLFKSVRKLLSVA
jgi:hypothetical protein